ncbi:ABC transporter ATP-binding protein [Salipiger sp. PrR002]|uniref:ABC transporter ATP-binding protein n=1 Tax=Salipiger sp. PrR002 TaxID=2706489 RepID=UPI0013BD8D48|nr:ABC transporter ATP-binding protein [Salipiger sp. PrR002]NDW01271.1 ABC transporter ATP-binding protein [Salipiger sp. PrR002]NDW58085.1 ABC transporter ATP-binding protein [Salipiger sp. PrR004]
MTQDPTPGDRRYLDVWGVAKSFKGTSVMSGMNFRVDRGELVSLLGPSGCGKTTLLRIIAGLMEADEGSVVLGGRDISRFPAHRRNVSVVFQNYALFPHLTVAENVAFGLRARGTPKAQIAGPVDEALRLVRMEGFAGRPISALSGGQQQRVAVARALVVGPDLLLLDEPFSALDRKLRETMQVELKSLLRDRGITAIFVTHDQEEAMGVSDRIAVMNAGKIEQFADPSTLYARPASPFVMDFVGLSATIMGTVAASEGGLLTLDTPYGTLRARGDLPVGGAAQIGVRPELIAVGQGENSLSVVLEDVMVLGSKTVLHGRAAEGDRILCELPGIRSGLARGETVQLGWEIADTLVYGGAA